MRKQIAPSALSSIISCSLLALCSKLYNHVKQLVNPPQRGILRNRPCTTQLLSVLDTVCQSLDKDILTDVVYLNFPKPSIPSIIEFYFTWKKNWVTFASNFFFVPRPPKNDPKIAEKQQNFERKFKFRSIKSYFFKMYGWI